MSRVLVWFSCGAASAVAAKIAVKKHGYAVEVVYCDVMSTEHPDNARFFVDIEKWLQHPIRKIASYKYTSIDHVFEKTRYMAGVSGARCTTEMKKLPRYAFQRPDDVHIFGLTADETQRIDNFKANNPDLLLEWPLLEHGITKDDCYSILREADIELPIMYTLGYNNNNCLGCVKASSARYWNMIRRDFPEVFA